MKGPVPIIVRNPVRVEAERAARSVRSLPAARYVLAVLALIILVTFNDLRSVFTQ
jgi:hypothetical protein